MKIGSLVLTVLVCIMALDSTQAADKITGFL